MTGAAIAEFGSVHVVANDAGVGVGGAVEELSLDDWRWVLDVNLGGDLRALARSCRT